MLRNPYLNLLPYEKIKFFSDQWNLIWCQSTTCTSFHDTCGIRFHFVIAVLGNIFQLKNTQGNDYILPGKYQT